ncbi:hypothetical protein KAJ61_06160, partial [Candidatus Parcubacteria bacterium]|nr:hypothetical protein [Candidatus Parcubacteria bacterium]
MLKIQLIQPPRNKGYVDSSRSACYPPIGLTSIATYCKKNFPNADIEILDGEFMALTKIIQKLKPNSFVGIETKMGSYAIYG